MKRDIVSSAGRSIIRDYKVPYMPRPTDKQIFNTQSHKDLIKHLNNMTIK